MKLSQVLKDWPEETKLYYEILGKLPSGKHREGPDKCDEEIADFLSKIPTSCDREIDREALEKYLENYFDNHEFADMTFCSGGLADDLIKSMPTWLKRIEDK